MSYIDSYGQEDHTRNLERLREAYSRVSANHQRALAEWYKESESLHNQVQELKEENQELRSALISLSLYVSAGMGDENTTVQDYVKRIKEGIDQLAADFKG